MDTSLDTTTFFAIFLTTTFAAALITGLAGFAFGLVAAAVWLYILTPLQTAALIIWFGLIVQGYAVWKLRQAVNWQRIAPMVIGVRSACRLAYSCYRRQALMPYGEASASF
jgi:uncharacterized membrane protein YfcA